MCYAAYLNGLARGKPSVSSFPRQNMGHGPLALAWAQLHVMKQASSPMPHVPCPKPRALHQPDLHRAARTRAGREEKKIKKPQAWFRVFSECGRQAIIRLAYCCILRCGPAYLHHLCLLTPGLPFIPPPQLLSDRPRMPQ